MRPNEVPQHEIDRAKEFMRKPFEQIFNPGAACLSCGSNENQQLALEASNG